MQTSFPSGYDNNRGLVHGSLLFRTALREYQIVTCLTEVVSVWNFVVGEGGNKSGGVNEILLLTGHIISPPNFANNKFSI